MRHRATAKFWRHEIARLETADEYTMIYGYSGQVEGVEVTCQKRRHTEQRTGTYD